MLATCHLRRFLLDAWPWQSQTFSRSGTKHIHWDNWTQKLSRAARCRSDRPLEFVNCHARPIATFAAFGLTGFSPRPAPTFAPDAEVADQKPHTHKFWVQVWNTSESFHWSLLINLEQSVEVEASLLIYGILSTAEMKRLSLAGTCVMPTPRGTWKTYRCFESLRADHLNILVPDVLSKQHSRGKPRRNKKTNYFLEMQQRFLPSNQVSKDIEWNTVMWQTQKIYNHPQNHEKHLTIMVFFNDTMKYLNTSRKSMDGRWLYHSCRSSIHGW